MLYSLRRLKKFGVGKDTLIQFYRAVIESVLTFSVTVWYGALTSEEHAKLDKIVFTASKVIGSPLDSIQSIYTKRSTKKIRSILKRPDHPACSIFEVLPSGKQFRSFKAKTNRFLNSFYVKAMRGIPPE